MARTKKKKPVVQKSLAPISLARDLAREVALMEMGRGNRRGPIAMELANRLAKSVDRGLLWTADDTNAFHFWLRHHLAT
jgi:hypothetical protein